ncbi:unnamed protein product [Dibothriocephalus latus]|uniref:Uncharacterized protein n=1 Tax=Dibothriocephalus latus TaxID=60516 RepID=A0A3P6R9T3_DIBLA|nr:unnamed protein product [Dibothriocephalus latus]
MAFKRLKVDEGKIILPADKGCCTVVLNNSDYKMKAQSLLDDQISDRTCPASEMKHLLTQMDKSLAKVKTNGEITPTDWFSMKLMDIAPARFYGLPKLHKENLPLGAIVSLRGTPTYGLAK